MVRKTIKELEREIAQLEKRRKDQELKTLKIREEKEKRQRLKRKLKDLKYGKPIKTYKEVSRVTKKVGVKFGEGVKDFYIKRQKVLPKKAEPRRKLGDGLLYGVRN